MHGKEMAITEGMNVEDLEAPTLKTDGALQESLAEIGISNSRLGTLILLAAEAMLFGGLLAALVVLAGKGRSTASQMVEPESSWWLLLAVGGLALLTIELARRSVGKGGRLLPVLGTTLAFVAGVSWLILTSPSIIGLGAGPLGALSAYTPVEACSLALHTLLALHIVLTVLLTAIAVMGALRSAEGVKEHLVRVEILWAFALIVQGAIKGCLS